MVKTMKRYLAFIASVALIFSFTSCSKSDSNSSSSTSSAESSSISESSSESISDESSEDNSSEEEFTVEITYEDSVFSNKYYSANIDANIWTKADDDPYLDGKFTYKNSDNDEDIATASINFATIKPNNDDTADDIHKSIKEQYENSDGCKILNETNETIGGKDAYVLYISEQLDSGENMIFVQAVVSHNNLYTLITYGSDNKVSEKLSPDFQKIIESITFNDVTE